MNIDAASKVLFQLIGELNSIPTCKEEGEALRKKITNISTRANRVLVQVRAGDPKQRATLRALSESFNKTDKKIVAMVQGRLGDGEFISQGVREFV